MSNLAIAAAPTPDPISYSGNFPAATEAGLTHATLTMNGQTRDLLVYRPAGVAVPSLLIFFSGTGSTLDYNTADELGREALRSFADANRTVIVFPIPVVQSHGDWDNHSAGTPFWETALGESTASAPNSDPDGNPDLLFTRAIIKESINRYAVDANKIFVNGFSNGAFFSYFAASVLNNRISAFAETGGGLVLDNTTAGEPTPCVSVPYASSDADEVRDCPAAGWTPGLCSSPGAVARPLSPASASYVPPAYLEANDNDPSVPFPHTCNLAASLPAATPRQVRITHSGLGHAVNSGYLQRSWDFMTTNAGTTASPQDLSNKMSAMWYDPAQSGHGMVFEAVTVNGVPSLVASWYVYLNGEQRWLFGSAPFDAGGTHVEVPLSIVTGPSFPPDFSAAAVQASSWGTLEVSFSSETSAHAQWRSTYPGFGNGSIDLVPIAHVLKPQDDPPGALIHACHSGNWYNPEQNGHGFELEVIPAGTERQLLAVWYVYDHGQQMFLVGTGAIAGDRATVQFARTRGGQFPPAFNSSQVTNEIWGNATFQFSDTNHATVSWVPTAAGFAAGNLALTRLTSLNGRGCD